MFAYCLNNPISYLDITGNCTTIANRDFCNLEPRPESCGGGAIGPVVTFCFLEWIGNVITNGADAFEKWIDDQKQSVADKVSKSLAKSKTDHSGNSYHFHHIVPQNDPRGLESYIILEKVFPDYGVQDQRNLIRVSSRIHARLHSDLYYRLVNIKVTLAYLSAGGDPEQQEANVAGALDEIKAFIVCMEKL